MSTSLLGRFARGLVRLKNPKYDKDKPYTDTNPYWIDQWYTGEIVLINCKGAGTPNLWVLCEGELKDLSDAVVLPLGWVGELRG